MKQPKAQKVDRLPILDEFWRKDTWEICQRSYQEKKKSRKIEFTCNSKLVNEEFKFACCTLFKNKTWSITSPAQIRRIHIIIKWINQEHKEVRSLVSKKLSEWIFSLRSYLISTKSWHPNSIVAITKNQTYKEYIGQDPTVFVFNRIYRVLEDFYDKRTGFEKDIWDCRHLGIDDKDTPNRFILYFSGIKQNWLKEHIKNYFQVRMNSISGNTLSKILLSLRRFSSFLLKKYPNITLKEVNRSTIIEYMLFLKEIGLSNNNINTLISQLKGFLEYCQNENIDNISQEQFVYTNDIPQRSQKDYQVIPFSVIEQLKNKIEDLPKEIKRITKVLLECGLRIGEACFLKYNCLDIDYENDYFLRYFQFKGNKENRVPITIDLARILIKQQNEIKGKFGIETKYLFYLNGKNISPRWYSMELNKFALMNNIRDPKGNLYRFKSHQFRHTLASTMINNGCKKIFVSKILGHSSGRSTNTYLEINDNTVKKAILEYKGVLFDSKGKNVGLNKIKNSFKSLVGGTNVSYQILPNGYCNFPISSGSCPFSNACFKCTHFLTDKSFLYVHKEQLKRTLICMKEAEKLGWKRYYENQKTDWKCLKEIIVGIEGGDFIESKKN